MNTRSIRFRLIVLYASLLASVFVLFCASTYLGVRHYLRWTIEELLTKRAYQLRELLIEDLGHNDETFVADEIEKRFAPQINDRFIRITRADGSVLYVSGAPKDASFTPMLVPRMSQPVLKQSMREVTLPHGVQMLIVEMPWAAPEGRSFLIEVGTPESSMRTVLRGLLIIFALSLPVVIVIAVAGGFLLIGRALAPVDEITQSAERITLRHLSERLPIARTGDELERLSSALNRMISRLEEAFNHTSRFTADASHELRTPLTVLRGELEDIAQKPQLTPEVREAVGSALEETERLAKIVENLLVISRLDAGEAHIDQSRFDLADLTANTVEQMSLLAEDKGISLHCEAATRVEVEGDRARLKQVIVNLLDNAIKYTPAGGSVHITTTAAHDKAILEVSDNGIGIAQDALPYVFERFYRADKARSRQMGGAGLGLSIVKSICVAHGGEVTVRSKENQGSSFRVVLPLVGRTAEIEEKVLQPVSEGHQNVI